MQNAMPVTNRTPCLVSDITAAESNARNKSYLLSCLKYNRRRTQCLSKKRFSCFLCDFQDTECPQHSYLRRIQCPSNRDMCLVSKVTRRRCPFIIVFPVSHMISKKQNPMLVSNRTPYFLDDITRHRSQYLQQTVPLVHLKTS